MSEHFWDDPVIILYLLLVIHISDNLWAIYLLLREIHVVYKVQMVPDLIRPYLPQELFEKMRLHKLHKGWFTIVNTMVMVIIMGVLELYFGLYSWLWDVATQCAVAQWMKHEVIVSLIFVFILSIYFWIKSLPGAIYEKLCIPSLHNRQKSSVAAIIVKVIVDIIVGILVTTMMVVALVYLTLWLGVFTALGLYLQSLIITFGLMIIIPFLIDPFLGKRVTLENTNLRTELDNLTKKVEFPSHQVVIIKVHDPSIGSNAFFYGFGCLKRIIIFDGLLLNRGKRDVSDLPPEEIGKGLRDEQVVAVVCHELGHWSHGHFCKTVVTFQVYLIVMLILFTITFSHGPIYEAVGFAPGVQPIIVGFFIIFGFVLTPYLTMANFVMLSLGRCYEYQADKFAFRLGYARELRTALLKLYADNLVFPVTDRCYSSWHDSHPTMIDRLERLDSLLNYGS